MLRLSLIGFFRVSVFAQQQGLLYFPVTPCRIVDTRSWAGFSGYFGPPSLSAGLERDFPVSQQTRCTGVQQSAQAGAYGLNFTLVPPGNINVFSAWSYGSPNPGLSTLYSNNARVIAGAAIVASNGGWISTKSDQTTDLLIDVNGYFATGSGGLAFYPVTPCRKVDTRSWAGFPPVFGPPSLTAGTGRDFPLMETNTCPSINLTPAQAYSLNVTAVPPSELDYLSVWPGGQPYPYVSTLNDTPGGVIANAAIASAGTPNGAVTVMPGQSTDVLLDINGYFAPPGPAASTFIL